MSDSDTKLIALLIELIILISRLSDDESPRLTLDWDE